MLPRIRELKLTRIVITHWRACRPDMDTYAIHYNRLALTKREMFHKSAWP